MMFYRHGGDRADFRSTYRVILGEYRGLVRTK